MSQPNSKQLKTPGAQILNAPAIPGGSQIVARQGDAVCHETGSGFHICMVPFAVVPVGGLQAGHSDETFRWSTGASYSGMGVPYTPAVSPTYDQAQTGYGTDGRINGGANGLPSF